MIRRRSKNLFSAAWIVLVGVAGNAGADILTFSDATGLAATNWSKPVTFPLFDPSLGTLNRVEIDLGGWVASFARFESMDAGPATIETVVSADITLQRPDASTLVTISPSVTRIEDVSAFDGVVDFSGSSGRKYNLSASAFESMNTTESADLMLFTGMGDILLPVEAVGFAASGGAGNLLAMFSTYASGGVSVTYHFTPIPAPSAALLGAMGMSFIVLASHRRKNRAGQGGLRG